MSAHTGEKIHEQLAQMNQILSDKEAAIDKKLKKLEDYEKQLKEFEQEVTQKVAELEKKKMHLLNESKKIEERWKEIYEYEENLKVSMESILNEKLAIEEKSKDIFLKGLEETKDAEMEMLDLAKLRERLNASEEELLTVPSIEEVSDSKTEVESEVKAEEIAIQTVDALVEAAKPVTENITEASKKETSPEDEIVTNKDGIPWVFLTLQKEIEKNYSKWNKIELLPERYCLEISTRPSREIRFFLKEELVHVDIIVLRKNARNDRKTQTEIINLSRVEPDWDIVAEENSIVCSLEFTNTTKVAFVLKKCSDFIKNHL